jgi:hypothetical protein
MPSGSDPILMNSPCTSISKGLSLFTVQSPEEQASPVATAQPEADPPLAEMGLYLEKDRIFKW